MARPFPCEERIIVMNDLMSESGSKEHHRSVRRGREEGCSSHLPVPSSSSSSVGTRGAPPEHRLLPAGLRSRSATMGISASSLLDETTAGHVTGTEPNRIEPSKSVELSRADSIRGAGSLRGVSLLPRDKENSTDAHTNDPCSLVFFL